MGRPKSTRSTMAAESNKAGVILSSGKSMTKARAVELALQAGHHLPEQGTSYIRDSFGIEVGKQHFSNIKTNLKKQKKGGLLRKAKPGRKPKTVVRPSDLDSYLAPPSRKRSAAGEQDLLAAMEIIKPLVADLGAEKVKRLVELFA